MGEFGRAIRLRPHGSRDERSSPVPSGIRARVRTKKYPSCWFKGTVGMSKEEFEQIWARKSLREMLSAIEVRVGKLEESMEDAKEPNNVLGEGIEDLREQSKDFVTMCLTS